MVISRAKSIYNLLKEYLKTSNLDLFDIWKAIKYALFNQLSELKAVQAKQQLRIPIELSGTLYGLVRGWVSHEALRKVEDQRKLLNKKDPPPSTHCTGSFIRSQGLPYIHTLRTMIQQSQALKLEHFHSHWHLIRSDTPQLLLEPR